MIRFANVHHIKGLKTDLILPLHWYVVSMQYKMIPYHTRRTSYSQTKYVENYAMIEYFDRLIHHGNSSFIGWLSPVMRSTNISGTCSIVNGIALVYIANSFTIHKLCYANHENFISKFERMSTNCINTSLGESFRPCQIIFVTIKSKQTRMHLQKKMSAENFQPIFPASNVLKIKLLTTRVINHWTRTWHWQLNLISADISHGGSPLVSCH